MDAEVLEVALSKLPTQVDWAAHRVAKGIPCGSLVTVCNAKAEIYGLVRRRQVLEEDEDTDDGFFTNLWLLRLARGLDGSYQWEDFIPTCQLCKERMRPLMSSKEQPPCPMCKGRKGKGNCFQFDCPQYSSASCGCGRVEAASRPVYCGSHPYFGGYEVKDECFANSSQPLFRYQVSSYDECDNFSLVADHVHNGGLQVEVFRGMFEETSVRVLVEEDKQSLISSTEVKRCIGATGVSSATLVSWNRHEGIHSSYIFVQRYGNESGILRKAENKQNTWLDWATIECDDECRFQKQVVVICKGGYSKPARIAGLSRDSLWVMDVPDANRGNEGPPTARSMANQISWQRVLKFTDVPDSDDNDDFDFEDLPFRFIACGPKPNQVLIFAADETSLGAIRPRLLVEIPASLSDDAAKTKTVPLTSVVNVPLNLKDVGEKELSSELLPSILRVAGQDGGYLFFNKQGQVYHVPDEAILPADAAWTPPDFKQGSGKHQVVSFNLRDIEGRSETRLCLASALERYEYFQKLLGHWQEGVSAEVAITDTDVDTFVNFLTYINNGTVNCQLELAGLVRLITLANKYLMRDLVAACLLRILSILQDADRMKGQEVSALADILAFSDTASSCCPALMRKLIVSVLVHRGDIVKDQEFLKQLAHASVKALSSLLTPLASEPDDQLGWRRARKRRKVCLNMQSSVWDEELRDSEWPEWC